MRTPRHTKRFRRNYLKMQRSGRKMQKVVALMDMLIDGKPLPMEYKDHPLQGDWAGMRDCHIEGDWILLYELGRATDGHEIITFHATDNHENLFG
ncbi:type II toxin-antitoxin system YafQ family toxin [Candidatus Peregrinibacteria bacterium]|nr:type II toxin-antitoxin system YafQ family toxin [Candidatus Peregrinibacteria bacterium]